ncbi:MAG: hypothetical protein WCA63_08770 [Gallionella sp.]
MDILRFANIPAVFIDKIQPSEVIYCKEIVAMNVIAKFFNPMTLASAAQVIWVPLHA